MGAPEEDAERPLGCQQQWVPGKSVQWAALLAWKLLSKWLFLIYRSLLLGRAPKGLLVDFPSRLKKKHVGVAWSLFSKYWQNILARDTLHLSLKKTTYIKMFFFFFFSSFLHKVMNGIYRKINHQEEMLWALHNPVQYHQYPQDDIQVQYIDINENKDLNKSMFFVFIFSSCRAITSQEPLEDSSNCAPCWRRMSCLKMLSPSEYCESQGQVILIQQCWKLWVE